MEQTNKTFEFHHEINDVTYTVKGIITSFDCNEDINIKNLDIQQHKDAIFNVSLTCSPQADLKIFDNSTAVVYVVAYNGREGQLGYVQDNVFIEENDENPLLEQVSVDILEVLIIDGSGHFSDQ